MSFSRLLKDFFSNPYREQHKLKQLNEQVKLDADLFMNMCKTLYAEAPPNSAILIMEGKLPLDENDDSPCELDCFVKKSQGKNAKFVPSLEAEETLCGLLRELRASMERQKQPRWKACKLTVDVPRDKYQADFKY